MLEVKRLEDPKNEKPVIERVHVLELVDAVMLSFRSGPADPYPDMSAAEFVVKELGGAIVDADPAPKYVAERLY